MDEMHRRYHVTQTTIQRADEIKEQARQAVLQMAVDGLNSHGLTQAIAQGVAVGWLQIASLDLERFEISEGLRRMADAIDANNTGSALR